MPDHVVASLHVRARPVDGWKQRNGLEAIDWKQLIAQGSPLNSRKFRSAVLLYHVQAV